MIVDGSALFIPHGSGAEKLLTLPRPISAIQLIQKEDGTTKLGLLSQLSAGTEVRLCGDGFNERTIKVRAHGLCYFVFRQDVLPQALNGAN